MILKRKNVLKIAIDSPAAAGAGTQARLISKHYTLLQLDTGLVYSSVANVKITHPETYNYNYIQPNVLSLKINDLEATNLLSNKFAKFASIIATDTHIIPLVHPFHL